MHLLVPQETGEPANTHFSTRERWDARSKITFIECVCWAKKIWCVMRSVSIFTPKNNMKNLELSWKTWKYQSNHYIFGWFFMFFSKRKLKIYSLTCRRKDVDHKTRSKRLNSPTWWRAGDNRSDWFRLGSVRLQTESVWGCRLASINGLWWAVKIWKAPRRAIMRVISPN